MKHIVCICNMFRYVVVIVVVVVVYINIYHTLQIYVYCIYIQKGVFGDAARTRAPPAYDAPGWFLNVQHTQGVLFVCG